MAPPFPPEIIYQIVECLYDDVASLRSAVRVNKTWAEQAISVLWEKPPASALAAIRADRRQEYARHIRELDFNADKDGQLHAHFRVLDFPRLRCVTIDFFRPHEGHKLWVGQYIQPALEDFAFYGAQPEEDILTRLESCPRLQRVVIGYPISGMDEPRLLEFFEKRKSVSDIVLPHTVSDVVTDQLVSYLVRRPGLKALELYKPQDYDDLTTALEGVDPFPDIVKLNLVVDSKTVGPWVGAIGSIQSLTLLIDSEDNTGILPRLGSLVHLRELEVVFDVGLNVPREDFLALQGLRHLELFKIDSVEAICSPTLTDQDLIKLWTSWRQLKYLDFQVHCSLSVAVLIELAERCPQLVVCEFCGSYDLQAWSDIPPSLFPNLKVLAIDEVDVGYLGESARMERAGTLVDLIIRHAPRLEELYLRNQGLLDDRVVTVFQTRTGQTYNA